MRVLYSTCFTDPWLKVAQKLKDEHGYEPVYWIGWPDDHSETLVPQAFPDCIYQRYFDAWTGVFPSQIIKHCYESEIDIDFIKEYASSELQAIKMMDRMDPDQFSFNFMERQSHYLNLLKLSKTCLQYLKIDIVISDNIPHKLFDYIMYQLCRFDNINYVCFGLTQFTGRFIPITDLSSINDQILIDYKNILLSDKSAELLKAELPNDIINYYNKTLQDYSIAKPDYEKLNLLNNKKSAGFFSLFIKFYKDVTYNNRDKYFGKDGYLLKGFPTYLKRKNKNIEKNRHKIIPYSIHKIKANRFKNRLKIYYKSLITQPDFDVKYVFFALHYQPEMSTCPSGDIFVNQRLCIEVLHKHLPSDYLIYVKEHQAQFYSHMEGHTSRTKNFYDDLISFPNVRLMPIDSDPFKLIRNAQAVATITGTIGWEAMVLGKPVISFGLIWYEKYEGVLKITNEATASKIREFILNYKYNEITLFAYLNAFSKNSSIVYAHRNDKEQVPILKTDCVDRLITLVKNSVAISKNQLLQG